MPYTKTAWVDGGPPGVSAEKLNNLETQYDSAVAWAQSFGLGGQSKFYYADLNDLTENGFYYAQTDATNKPTNTNYHIIVIAMSTTYVMQIAGRHDRTYVRFQENGVWGQWQETLVKKGDVIESNVTIANSKLFTALDTAGNEQIIGAINSNNEILLGDSDLVTYIRGNGTNIKVHEIYNKNNIKSGTALPSGGSDGDIYIQY